MNCNKELIGKPSYMTLLSIGLAHPNLESFELVCFPEPPLLQERCSSISRHLMDRAMEKRRTTVFSFWDSLLSTHVETKSKDLELIRHALFHNQQTESRFSIAAQGLTVERIENAIASLDEEQVVALSSRVQVGGANEMHLPLLDFHCSSSEPLLELVKGVAEELIEGDYFVVDSGKSFHVIGSQFLDTREWTQLLHRALLLNPIVDTRFVAHQLIQGECKLRLKKSIRKAKSPLIIDFVRRDSA